MSDHPDGYDDPEPLEPADVISPAGEDVEIVADVRPLEPSRTASPGAQAAAVGVGIVAGAATVAVLHRRRAARAPSRRARRKKARRPEILEVVTSRSFLVDVHLLNRPGD